MKDSHDLAEFDLFRMLYDSHIRNGHAIVPHVALGAAPIEGAKPRSKESIRYIDALLLFRDGKRRAVEIKVSANDLTRELKAPG